MYDGKRTPDLLFAAIARLREERHPAGMQVRVDFYGPSSDNVIPAAHEHQVADAVTHHGIVPRTRAMQAQAGSAGLLIFLNMDPGTASETGSKYLEYLGARKPIVALGPQESVMRGLIERNGLGYFASNSDDAAHALKLLHDRYVSGHCSIDPDPRQFPNAIDLAGAFAAELDEAITAGSRARVA